MHGNPINYVDPSGEAVPLWVAALAIGCGAGFFGDIYNQIQQDKCGGNFFDKLKRVDFGQALGSCKTYGLFGLGLFFLGGGLGSAIAWGAGLGVSGYLAGTAFANLIRDDPLLQGITVRGLGVNMVGGGLLGGLNSLVATARISTAGLPLFYRITPDAVTYMIFGVAFTQGQHLLTDDDPFNSPEEIGAVHLSGVLNATSVVPGYYGIFLTFAAVSIASAVGDIAD